MLNSTLVYFNLTLRSAFQTRLRSKEVFAQIEFVALKSIGIVLFCVGFAAMVTLLESSYHMRLAIQNDSMVPGFAAMLILRELGAVVTCLLLASKIGASIAAEIGTMKNTEQLEALKMLGINIYQFLVLPRLVGTAIGASCLTLVANLFCLLCAALVADLMLGFTSGFFITSLNRFVEIQDLFFSMIKGFTFGLIIPIVSCYQGLHCKPGAEGVGQATTQSVVYSSIGIIIFDFILSYTFSFFY